MDADTPPTGRGDAFDIARAQLRLPDPERRRRIREAARLSRRVSSIAIGCHETTIAHWENGTRNPSGDLLIRYCAFLDQLVELLAVTELTEVEQSDAA